MSVDPTLSWSTSRSLHPALGMRAAAPMRDVLLALDHALRRSGFRIGHRRPDGFRARSANWWALLVDDIQRSELSVSATMESGTTDVVVRVVSGAQHPRAADRAARGLQRAVDGLRRRHVTVTVTAWNPR